MRDKLNKLIRNPIFNTIGILICLSHALSWYIIFHNNHFRRDLIDHPKIVGLAAILLALTYALVVIILFSKKSRNTIIRIIVCILFIITLIGAMMKLIYGFSSLNESSTRGNVPYVIGVFFFSLFLIIDAFNSNRLLMLYGGLNLLTILLYSFVSEYSHQLINYERLLFMFPSILLIYIFYRFRHSENITVLDIIDRDV